MAGENFAALRAATAGAALVFSALMQRAIGETVSLKVYLGWLFPALIYGAVLALPVNVRACVGHPAILGWGSGVVRRGLHQLGPLRLSGPGRCRPLRRSPLWRLNRRVSVERRGRRGFCAPGASEKEALRGVLLAWLAGDHLLAQTVKSWCGLISMRPQPWPRI